MNTASELRSLLHRGAGRRRPLAGLLVALALLWTAFSTLSVYPHQLAYFNELAGGPEEGHRHLLGSNLDWGQDLLFGSAASAQHRVDGYLIKSSYNPASIARLPSQERLVRELPHKILLSQEVSACDADSVKRAELWGSRRVMPQAVVDEYDEFETVTPALAIARHARPQSTRTTLR